jgi:hypothetical protein
MKLSDYELIVLEQLYSASRLEREPKDVVNDCREATTALLQHFCLYDCNIKEDSQDFRNYWGYLTDFDTSFFYGKKQAAKNSYQTLKKEAYTTIQINIKIIKNQRKHQSYKRGKNDKDDAMQVFLTLKKVCKLYFNDIRDYKYQDVENLPETFSDLFKSLIPAPKERFSNKKSSEEINYERIIRQRPIYYVLVLIDASSSMLWPFLKDQASINNPDSSDYKQAIKKLQSSIKKAHLSALNALRGSRDCQQRNLKVCQYIFNHEMYPLNAPVVLDKDGMDEVKTLSPENYYPDGMTALYDTIEQSTRLISKKYIMPSKERMEVDKLILVVITDGEDTYIKNTGKYILGSDKRWREQEIYKKYKKEQIGKIHQNFKLLRGHGNYGQKHLESAILIGLTNKQFSEKALEKLQDELGFNESIPVNQNDEQALRRAFNLLSSNSLNT